jgi:protein-S-isoprenylcysteine O-methyltransferase Ste14
VNKARSVFGGVIVVYFVIALEVLVMISPFAGFFYAAFNPVLLFFARWPATRWLAAFFLPHMVLPPGVLLRAIRVAGSVLFVAGAVMFVACAAQVYSLKLLRRGPALGGLYHWIRHPQYLALAITGVGLAILWPRFLTVVLWVVMLGLYWLLAKDEERRMLGQFGDQYREYMERTGMFLPRSWEGAARFLPGPLPLRAGLGFVLLAVVAIGGAFALRSYTVAQLPLWSEGRVTAMTILPGDAIMLEHRMADVLDLREIKGRLAEAPGPILVYLVPPQYVMQGMIADTGPEWRLYQHHQTLPMIVEWIFHPFRHLQGGHMMHRGGAMPGQMTQMGGMSGHGPIRRLIFLRLEGPAQPVARSALFGVNAHRVPLFFADLDIHNLILLDLKPLGPGTGWGRVPTPMF